MVTRMTQPSGTQENASLERLHQLNLHLMRTLVEATSQTAPTMCADPRMSTEVLACQPYALMYHSRFGGQLLITKTTATSQRQLILCIQPRPLRLEFRNQISSNFVTALLSAPYSPALGTASRRASTTRCTTGRRKFAIQRMIVFGCEASCKRSKCSKDSSELWKTRASLNSWLQTRHYYEDFIRGNRAR